MTAPKGAIREMCVSLNMVCDDAIGDAIPVSIVEHELRRLDIPLRLAPTVPAGLSDLRDRWSAERRLAAALAAAVPGLTLDHVVDALFRLDLDLTPRSAVGVDRGQAATAAVPVGTIRSLCAALEHLCETEYTVPADTIDYTLAGFDPSPTTISADRVRAAATGQGVVIGRYSDGSSLSAVCYGPYDAERAEAVAGLLNAGSWYGMEWQVIPLGVLPGGET